MKRLGLLMFLAVATPSLAMERPDFGAELYAEQETINKIVQTIESDDYFAGKLVTLQLFGRKVPVDRRAQPPVSGAADPNPSLLNILDGLDAHARGEMELHVKRDWTDAGTLKHEEWVIKFKAGGGLSKEPKPELTPDKEGKTTGEKKE